MMTQIQIDCGKVEEMSSAEIQPSTFRSRTVYLCGGLQGSGSTLISWCFLQRADMDGILDAAFDSLPQIPRRRSIERPWCKFTIACFRIADVKQHLEDEGWQVQPLLIARDVRAVFNSLIGKKYGRNGTTADDPPLRLRLRRFHRDWQMFRDNGWPILRYEDFIAEPIQSLRQTCAALKIPFDSAMVQWPKPIDQISAAENGNATFARTRGATLLDSIRPSLADVKTQNIPPVDLEWMEREFADLNFALGYPRHVSSQASPDLRGRATPNLECTRKHGHLRRTIRRARRWRYIVSTVVFVIALTILADAKNWIKCIDFI